MQGWPMVLLPIAIDESFSSFLKAEVSGPYGAPISISVLCQLWRE
jgi:hypothetical protein